eukprot:13805812-Alexandrium_andersonii.AAC.1
MSYVPAPTTGLYGRWAGLPLLMPRDRNARGAALGALRKAYQAMPPLAAQLKTNPGPPWHCAVSYTHLTLPTICSV